MRWRGQFFTFGNTQGKCKYPQITLKHSTNNYLSISHLCTNALKNERKLKQLGLTAPIPSPYGTSHTFQHCHKLSTWSDRVVASIVFVRIRQVVNSRFSPTSEAPMSSGRLLHHRELEQMYDRKEQTVSILSVTCCVSPGSCHFLPFIFHRRSTLRFALAAIHSPSPPALSRWEIRRKTKRPALALLHTRPVHHPKFIQPIFPAP